MRFIAIILFLLTTIVGCFGQSIAGSVKDSIKNEAIDYASIRLLNSQDSSYVAGAITSNSGAFNLSPKTGSFLLEISSIGYHKYHKRINLTAENPSVNLGTVYLKESSVVLKQAIVYAPVPDIVVKGDTIEYNADAYKVGDDALLQDVIKRMPGFEITQDGKLMANGKVVTKLRIDGKEFFDNDIDLALKNLPASMINKLQLFKEENEMSKLTGFKSGAPEQVLNLTVKEELKQSVFGDIQASYGTDDRYYNKANAHYMTGDRQYSLLSNINNITDDYEYSSSSGQYDGTTKNEKIGFNFGNESNKNLKIGGSIRYEHSDNLFEMNSNTQTFIETGNRFGEENSANTSVKRNLATGVNLVWTPDSMTTITARFNVSVGTNDDLRNRNSISYLQNLPDTTRGRSHYKTSGDTDNLNTSIFYSRKLNSKGRVLSFNVNGGTRKNSNNGTNYSTTSYQGVANPKIIDQELFIDNNNNSWGIMASYVEPVGQGNSIQVSYTLSNNHSDNNKNTFKRNPEGEYTVIDTAYTRKSVNKYFTQRFNVGFQSIKDKYEYTVGFNVDPSHSSSVTSMRDSIIEDQSQRVLNFSPTIRFSYKPKEDMTFDFDYYGVSSQPTLRQLSADTTIIDALSKIYGNPNLKASYDNNFNMYFQKSNYEKGSFFILTMGGSYIINKIVDVTTIDQNGNTESSYKNVSGNWGLNGGLMFSTPLRNKKFVIDNSSYGYLTRNIGFSNGVRNLTTNLALSQKFTVAYRGDKVNQRLQLNLAGNITRNSLPNQTGLNTANYGFDSSTAITLPYDISIQNSISYTYNYGYAKEFKNTELLWNASISKKFLKKKQLMAKVQCYDILNDRNNVIRMVTGNYISDTRTNMIGSYVLFSLSYKFNVVKGGSNSVDENTDYYGY